MPDDKNILHNVNKKIMFNIQDVTILFINSIN